MSETLERPVSGLLSLEDVRQFLTLEARYLDDKQWSEWLELYHENAEFWMPSWDDDGQLVTDPQTEISMIYYGHRGGLEDRVFRIRTERSSATSLPEPRTSHNISNVEILSQTATRCELRAALQLGDVQLPLQDRGHVFRHLVLHAGHQRREAVDHA